MPTQGLVVYFLWRGGGGGGGGAVLLGGHFPEIGSLHSFEYLASFGGGGGGGSYTVVEIYRFYSHRDSLYWGTEQTGVTFEKFLMHFQSFRGLNFQNFPGGACPQIPLANECLCIRPVPPWRGPCRRCTLCRSIVWNGAQKNGSEGRPRWGDTIAKIREAWVRFVYDNTLLFPFSTPHKSIPSSVVISECKSGI